MTTLTLAPSRRDTDFAELAPLFGRLAAMPARDPARPSLRERLIVGHLPLAPHVAARYRNTRTPGADLVQVATVGLINAVDRYDPGQGTSFPGYAIPTMSGEVRRYLRDHGWSLRMPRRVQDLHREVARASEELSQELGRSPRPSEVAERLGVDVEDVRDALAADQANRPLSIDHPTSADAPLADVAGDLDAALAAVDDREAVRPLLHELDPAERRMLHLRFFGEMSQSRIAAELGCSQMHVSRTLDRVLNRLRRHAAA